MKPPFQALFDAHAADVHRLLRASLAPADADDCFQDTWIAALRAYPGLGRTDNLRAWVLTIAHRKALDAHRARGRRAIPVEEPPERGEPPATDGELGLWRAVRGLPPKQRAAVAHRYVLDLPYAEIARVVGCSEEAARRNVHEGIATLRRTWDRG